MAATAATIVDASATRIEPDVPIEAPIDEVWSAVIEEPDAWWITELRCVPGGSKVVLDACAGGSFVEQNDAGGSQLWFTVIHVDPPRSTNLVGAIARPFKGPRNAFLHIQLEERDGETLVTMTNSTGQRARAGPPSWSGRPSRIRRDERSSVCSPRDRGSPATSARTSP